MQCGTAKQQHGEHHQLRTPVGDDGAANRGSDRVVNDFHRLHFAKTSKVFADTVKNHHGLVHRVTQHSQNSGQDWQ